MNHLSRAYLPSVAPASDLQLPDEALFNLPEKVLQFGTGVLLRGLPDYFIDKANRQGIFNGRIVVVKSTDSGDSSSFDKQDNLYTLCVRGIENGQVVEEDIICSAISRVLSAKTQWQSVLACAGNPDMQVVISNTTEVGIQLLEMDTIDLKPPVSFPGKLLAFLYERFKAFGGSKDSGLVIVPTELIVDNGKKLESIVLELAYRNGLKEDFLDWIENYNFFCNSLVDRIVPGKPDAQFIKALEGRLNYTDALLAMSEVYRLWAIEGNEAVKSVLSFYQVDEGVRIEPSIDTYRELKLRLLNGTHTLSCGLAFMAGFSTVKAAMQHQTASGFISKLMLSELAASLPDSITEAKAQEFGLQVLDRFRNPYIEHKWISITLQYSFKMKTRNVASILNYYRVHNRVPEYVSLGFAAYLLFMKAVREERKEFYGEINGENYLISDDKAAYYYEKWNTLSVEELVADVLQNEALWGENLSNLPGFAASVTENLKRLQSEGALACIASLLLGMHSD
ncbi:tagaturonate reductase [Rhodocytophaga rosea]|uniref:Tagaturonate reductase n=1 Tax=Rhodocytophaga rosea TaxID=2704465 RepID=A0A6C0GCC5_9BACT|nr:tagaturonate reductase [Rhodocytophaga rosea]QHT65504.1 tagaturonate reductase [Rhodocytophaga rosea]